MLNVILGSSNPYFFSLDRVVVAGYIHIITFKHKDKENSSINFPLYFFYFQNFTFCQILHFFNRIFIRQMTK